MGYAGKADKARAARPGRDANSHKPSTVAPSVAATPLARLAEAIRTSPVMQARTAAIRSAIGAALEPKPAGQRAAEPNRTGLPDALKANVEAISGFSMDDVRVHRNSPKPAQLRALAYAQGTEIHLAPGQERHLPHEAWHVVQQKQGRVKPTLQMKGVAINDEVGLEREADLMGMRVRRRTGAQPSMESKNTPLQARISPIQATPVIQREDFDLRDKDFHSEKKDDFERNALRDQHIPKAKLKAIELAANFAMTKKPGHAVKLALEKLELGQFQVTQLAYSDTGETPVEWVWKMRDGQIASAKDDAKGGGRDNQRDFIITIDMDQPPADSQQAPHVGYTSEVRVEGKDAKVFGREFGHVWVNAVPAGRTALKNAKAAPKDAKDAQK
jgi:Domain of unknown function (DUF4157)